MLTAARVEDHQAHAIAIGEDGRVPETQHPKALPLKIGRAARIIGDLIGMLPAVNFDDETGVGTIEVHDVGTARNLALPPPAAEAAITQKTPQTRLGLRVLAAEAPGAISLSRVP